MPHYNPADYLLNLNWSTQNEKKKVNVTIYTQFLDQRLSEF